MKKLNQFAKILRSLNIYKCSDFLWLRNSNNNNNNDDDDVDDDDDDDDDDNSFIYPR